MPDKNPEFWAVMMNWLHSVAPNMYAVALSIVIAVLRVVYGGGTRRQMVLESSMCGFATLMMVPLLEYLGLPQDMATFFGGLVGFIGVEKFRELAIKFGERKIGL